MKYIPCSVPILTLNSEKHLARCLESVKNFQDVYIVDGNSTDRTIEIAKHYNVPIYKQIETDETDVVIQNFTEMRYRSIGFAKTDWILILDSDEYISEELEGEIGDLFGRGLDAYSICMIEKKIQVKDQKVLYSFNYPNYLPRLFNTKTGARFKSGKIVHEQMSVPENLTPVRLKNCFWAQTSDNYRACVKKDVYQLGLMKRSTFSEASFKSRMHSFKMAIVYFLRAINIIRKALSVYIRFGYKHALPAGQVLRHVRVHLIISYWRFVQCIFGNKSHVYYEATSR